MEELGLKPSKYSKSRITTSLRKNDAGTDKSLKEKTNIRYE
jgi:hypothetical protein